MKGIKNMSEKDIHFRFKDLKNGTYQIHTKKYGAYEGHIWQAINKAKKFKVKDTLIIKIFNTFQHTEVKQIDVDGDGNIIKISQ